MRKLFIIFLVVLLSNIVITTVYFLLSKNKVSQFKSFDFEESKIEQAKKNALSEFVMKNEQGDVLIVNEPEYQIIYLEKSDQFLLSILKSPFETIRKEAEQKFLRITKADKETLCKLNVEITTPFFANPDLAGQIFSLSFCEISR